MTPSHFVGAPFCCGRWRRVGEALRIAARAVDERVMASERAEGGG